MDDLDRLQGRYPENFVLISQLEVCQEGWVKKGGTWRTLSVPDWKAGGLFWWAFTLSLAHMANNLIV